MKKCLLLMFLLLGCSLFAALECSSCGKRIYGEYIKSSKAVFCSRRCFRKSLPVCVACQQHCEKSILTFMGKTFCSKRCMEQTFQCKICRTGLTSAVTMVSPGGEKMMVCRRCSQRPSCYYCAFPSDTQQLSDGRNICRTCRKTAVYDIREIRRLFQMVRRDMAAWFGYDVNHRIELHVVDARRLNELSKSVYSPGSGRRMALMAYHKEVTEKRSLLGKKERFISSETCRIYVLGSTPRAMLLDAIAHELTHDHLRHNVGEVKDLASEEGFCELAASLYNIRNGNKMLNVLKEKAQDPIYGGGYRKMKKIYDRTRSLQKTMQFVR